MQLYNQENKISMLLSQRILILVFVSSVFMAGLWQGFSIAFQKPLWNDEIYSQVSSVENISWALEGENQRREQFSDILFSSEGY
jgi:hypothetical protein